MQLDIPTRTLAADATPFLKWLGGKRWLIERRLNVPEIAPGATYFEPFVGAGSVFFALRPTLAVISDTNAELINTYRQVSRNVEKVIERLYLLPNNLETFEKVRSSRPSNQVERAVRFLYLNRTAYGGMYRVNARGEFNVPYGRYLDRRIAQPEVLRAASDVLRGADITTADFAKVLKHASPGDFVYLDPPYDSRGSRELFSRYTSKIFTWEMHERLATVARSLADSGVHVLISNTAHQDVADLYRDFEVRIVKRSTRLSSDPLRRGYVEEAIISSYAGAVE